VALASTPLVKRAVGGFAAAILILSVAPPDSSARTARTARLSRAEKIGQLVMFAVDGRSLSEHERTVMKRLHLGAVILFRNNYADRIQLANLTGQIQRAARNGNSLGIGALISVDQEGGVVKRFPDMPPRYSAPEMRRIGKTTLAYDQGRATGRALIRTGVNSDLAPVADLDLPPEHIMRERAFGEEPDAAARLVRAFARGLQAAGVGATLKHFPGLGGATINSDFGKAYVRRSRWRLRHIDAVPFERAIEGGAKLVMLSHGIYTRDGGPRPASLNFKIATQRLRDGFAFDGVAISDALEPIAWWFKGQTAKACPATIKAGVDIALITGNVDTAGACVRAIRASVASGGISRARLDRAVARVLALKEWLGLAEVP
jgi:beta-N-acetylhexosaminidase